MDCLSDLYRKEQQQYYMSTTQWCDIHPSQMIGTAAPFKHYDLHKVTIEELKVRAEV